MAKALWRNNRVSLPRIARVSARGAAMERIDRMNPGTEAAMRAPPASQGSVEIEALYAKARVFQQFGQVAEACAWYERVVEACPGHFDALRRLGLLEHQRGNYDAATRSLTRALKASATSSAALTEIVELLIKLQRHDDALVCLRKISAIESNSIDDHLRHGIALSALGQFAEAVACFDKAMAMDPSHVQAMHHKGDALNNLGRFADAIASYDRTLVLAPSHVEALINRGVAYRALGQLENAIADFDAALKLAPDHVAGWYNRGVALYDMGRYEETIESYDQALLGAPSIGAVLNRGVAYEALGQWDNAIADFDQAIKLAPDGAAAWHNRGDALCKMGRYQEALVSYDRAEQCDSKLSQPWLGRANLFLKAGRTADALAACERALSITPDFPSALTIMGQCHSLMGDAETAVKFLDRSLAIKPDDETAITSKIFSLDFANDADFRTHQAARAEWWRRIGIRIAAQHPPHHQNDRDPTRRIILGYVSADFRLHSAASNFLPVLENHDKTRFEVICYSATLQEDDVTKFFRNMADRWRNITQWSDDRLAKCIKDDQVDILIDLSGPSEGNRLRAFARKPAPIQVTAWGHATGTGQPTIDYLFSDPVLVPSEARHLFAEQICDLPCVIIIQPPPDELRSDEPPVTSNGYLTYGVFNRVRKISSAAVSVWARILRSDTTARLVVKDHALSDSFFQNTLSDHFARLGIDLDRIELIGRTSRADHMKAYGRVDICLDPFPHGGGVSTWEALYMGVPVVTKLGNSITQRLGGAILSAIGMNEWIATDDDQYVDIALKPTTDRLRTLRRTLPGMIHARCSPIAYTKAVEHAYQVMWKKYCAH
jgi:predicted O-linked N-acetylglucosamine transferase (SPINDLY family)